MEIVEGIQNNNVFETTKNAIKIWDKIGKPTIYSAKEKNKETISKSMFGDATYDHLNIDKPGKKSKEQSNEDFEIAD